MNEHSGAGGPPPAAGKKKVFKSVSTRDRKFSIMSVDTTKLIFWPSVELGCLSDECSVTRYNCYISVWHNVTYSL